MRPLFDPDIQNIQVVEARGERHDVDIAETEILAGEPNPSVSPGFFHLAEHFFECEYSLLDER